MFPQNKGQGIIEIVVLISKLSLNSFPHGMLTDEQLNLTHPDGWLSHQLHTDLCLEGIHTG